MSWGKALIWGTVIVAVLTCSTSSSCVAGNSIGTAMGSSRGSRPQRSASTTTYWRLRTAFSRRQHKPSGIGVPERVHFTKF